MKNIHILPTDKETRLYLSNYGKELNLASHPKTLYSTGQNIYITSDEDIKDGDWYYDLDLNELHQYIHSIGVTFNTLKKIILTTDQNLIKDDVQAIDDEFLEWFVKNPNCEEIEVNYDSFEKTGAISVWEYEIIIPKEEPKQDAFNYSLNAFKVPKEYFGKEEPKQETLEEYENDNCIKFEIYLITNFISKSDMTGNKFYENNRWECKITGELLTTEAVFYKFKNK